MTQDTNLDGRASPPRSSHRGGSSSPGSSTGSPSLVVSPPIEEFSPPPHHNYAPRTGSQAFSLSCVLRSQLDWGVSVKLERRKTNVDRATCTFKVTRNQIFPLDICQSQCALEVGVESHAEKSPLVVSRLDLDCFGDVDERHRVANPVRVVDVHVTSLLSDEGSSCAAENRCHNNEKVGSYSFQLNILWHLNE